jgi:hypothetical protein
MRFRTIYVFMSLTAILMAARPAVAACSNASLNGVYGYYHGRPGGTGNLRVLVGQIIADGKGDLSGSWTMSFNGSISNGTFTGSYLMSANCTGSFQIFGEDTSVAHFNIVLDQSHTGFQMIQTDTGFDQPGFGIAQGNVSCGLSGKKQTFATNLTGVQIASSEAEGVVGQITLDGHGNISGFETFSVGGTISGSVLTGTYSIDSICLGTAQITPMGGPTTNFNTVVVNSGKAMLLIETDNTTLIAGTAQK